jgi:hypothetical protein
MPTGRQLTVEVTTDMIREAQRYLQRFDPEFTRPRDGAEALLCAALRAGGFIVSLQMLSEDCVHS